MSTRPRQHAFGIVRLVTTTFRRYVNLRGPLVSAAITFYVLLAGTPVVVLGMAVAGVTMGDAHARAELLAWTENYLGETGADAVERYLLSVDYFEGGIVAALGGVLVLLFSASRLFSALQHGLNQVWGVRLRTDRSFRKVAGGLARKRAFSFLLVLAVGALLTAGLVARAIWHAFFYAEAAVWQAIVGQVLSELLITSVLASAVFIVTFRVLPDARVRWGDAIVGGLATGLFFALGALLAGTYVQHVSSGSALGAAGTLGVLLLWINYCANVYFFGATFTHAWAQSRGRGVVPEPHAEKTTE